MTIEERNRRAIVFATMFMLITYVFAAVINTTIIFADSSHVCLSMLSKKDWCLYDEMKNFGLAIRQMFAMAYLKLADVPKVLTFIKILSFGYTVWTSFFVSAKYSCGFPAPQVSSIIVVDRYLDYFTTIMEDRLWQLPAKPVFR